MNPQYRRVVSGVPERVSIPCLARDTRHVITKKKTHTHTKNKKGLCNSKYTEWRKPKGVHSAAQATIPSRASEHQQKVCRWHSTNGGKNREGMKKQRYGTACDEKLPTQQHHLNSWTKQEGQISMAREYGHKKVEWWCNTHCEENCMSPATANAAALPTQLNKPKTPNIVGARTWTRNKKRGGGDDAKPTAKKKNK